MAQVKERSVHIPVDCELDSNVGEEQPTPEYQVSLFPLQYWHHCSSSCMVSHSSTIIVFAATHAYLIAPVLFNGQKIQFLHISNLTQSSR